MSFFQFRKMIRNKKFYFEFGGYVKLKQIAEHAIYIISDEIYS